MTKQTSSSISLRCDIYESLAGGHQFNLSALADSNNDGMPDEFEVSGMPCYDVPGYEYPLDDSYFGIGE